MPKITAMQSETTGMWMAHVEGMNRYLKGRYYTKEMAEVNARCWLAFHGEQLEDMQAVVEKLVVMVDAARRNDKNYRMFKDALTAVQETTMAHKDNVALREAYRIMAKEASSGRGNRVRILDVWRAEMRGNYGIK